MENRSGREMDTRRVLLYAVTVAAAVLLLFVGNRVATDNLQIFQDDFSEQVAKARVVGIVERNTDGYDVGGNTVLENVYITFDAEILNGTYKGQTITAAQSIDNMHNTGMNEVGTGDRVLLMNASADGMGWQFIEFIKADKLFIFGMLLVAALLVFGRKKGVNTLLSLVFTCAAIFAVFIPSILAGRNIYFWSVLVCLYAIMTTFLIVSGYNQKTWAAVAGCIGGIAVSGLLIFIMDKVLALTGIVDEESMYLTYLPTEFPIDLNAIVFAAIIIGAMGAIMDVAMSISSSLWEVKEESKSPTFEGLYRSGVNIGRDIMGTMANTLILAYIGSSLSVVLLLSVYSTSLTYLLNREMIVVEILKALVGSFGILITMPLTSLVCAAAYTRTKPKVIKIRMSR
jgi:uncharacterized membrane protein